MLDESTKFIEENAAAVPKNRAALHASARRLDRVGTLLDHHRLQIESNTKWMKENRAHVEQNAQRIMEQERNIEETKVFLAKARDDITRNAADNAAHLGVMHKTTDALVKWVHENGEKVAANTKLMTATREAAAANAKWITENDQSIGANQARLNITTGKLDRIHVVEEHNHELVQQLYASWDALAERATGTPLPY